MCGVVPRLCNSPFLLIAVFHSCTGPSAWCHGPAWICCAAARRGRPAPNQASWLPGKISSPLSGLFLQSLIFLCCDFCILFWGSLLICYLLGVWNKSTGWAHTSGWEQEGTGYNFFASLVNRNVNYIFGILTSRAIDWYINESILRGSGGGGNLRISGGSPEFYWAIFTK
jgi:hypothetical protein